MLLSGIFNVVFAPVISYLSKKQYIKNMDRLSIVLFSMIIMMITPYLSFYTVVFIVAFDGVSGYGPLELYNFVYFPLNFTWIAPEGCYYSSIHINLFGFPAQPPLCGESASVVSLFFVLLWEHGASLVSWGD